MQFVQSRLRRLVMHYTKSDPDMPMRSVLWSQAEHWSRWLLSTPAGHFLVTLLGDDHPPFDWRTQQQIAAWLRDSLASRVFSVPRVEVVESERAVLLGPLASEPIRWSQLMERMATKPELAERVGTSLAQLHMSLSHPFNAPEPLADRSRFHSQRIYPDFQVTARSHPDIATVIEAIVRETMGLDLALSVGGQASEMLFLAGQVPVWFGFELAHPGDPAIDVATLLSALLIRACASAGATAPFIAAAHGLWHGYLSAAGPEFGHSGMPQGSLEARVCRQVGVLMLSAVDGHEGRTLDLGPRWEQGVRTVGRGLIMRPFGRLDGVFTRVRHVSEQAETTQPGI